MVLYLQLPYIYVGFFLRHLGSEFEFRHFLPHLKSSGDFSIDVWIFQFRRVFQNAISQVLFFPAANYKHWMWNSRNTQTHKRVVGLYLLWYYLSYLRYASGEWNVLRVLYPEHRNAVYSSISTFPRLTHLHQFDKIMLMTRLIRILSYLLDLNRQRIENR